MWNFNILYFLWPSSSPHHVFFFLIMYVSNAIRDKKKEKLNLFFLMASTVDFPILEICVIDRQKKASENCNDL